MNPISSPNSPKISLLLADVDGTLVTKEKILTDRTRAPVHKLWDVGIRFAITFDPSGVDDNLDRATFRHYR